MKTYSDDEQRKKDEGEPSSYTPRSELPEDEPKKETPPEYAVPEKCNIIEQMRISIVSPKQLIGLSFLKVSRFVRYVIFLSFLVVVMTDIVPMAATIAGFGGFNKLFKEKMTDFSVQDGVLTAKDTFSMTLGDYEIIMDTSEDAVSQEKFIGKFITIAIGKRRVQVVVTQSGMSEVAMDYSVSSYFADGFTREDLVSAIPGFYLGLGIIVLVSMLWIVGKYLLASLIYMLLSNVLVRQSGLSLTRGNVFRLCFYAQTIGILLVNLNQATGGYIPGIILTIVGIFITLRWILKTFVPYIQPPAAR